MNPNIHYTTHTYQEVYKKIWTETHRGAYVSYLRGKRCQTDESFFCEISASFQFPAYFGANWNALNDCLRDLDWLSFTQIFIALDDFSLAYPEDPEGRQLLLKSLELMVEYWKSKRIEVEIWLNN